MDNYELAFRVYAIARSALDDVAEAKLLNDELLWATEDLEEVLLDLKRAVMAKQESWMEQYMLESSSLVVLIQDINRPASGGDEAAPSTEG